MGGAVRWSLSRVEARHASSLSGLGCSPACSYVPYRNTSGIRVMIPVVETSSIKSVFQACILELSWNPVAVPPRLMGYRRRHEYCSAGTTVGEALILTAELVSKKSCSDGLPRVHTDGRFHLAECLHRLESQVVFVIRVLWCREYYFRTGIPGFPGGSSFFSYSRASSY